MRVSVGCWIAVWLLVLALTAPALAEEKSPTETAFGDLIEIGAELQIASEGSAPLTFQKQPLVSWSNPTRNSDQHGCIFVWTSNGRPQVIGSLFTFVMRNELRIKHQLHSLSQEPLVGTFRQQTVWKPTKPGIEWLSVAEDVPPHSSERLRLTQMRTIARQYQAKLERSNGVQISLELKPTPIYRYASKEENVLDGAIFSFANGTDPDVLLLVEAYTNEQSQIQWRAAFARFHYWRVFVQDQQGETVWNAEAVDALSLMEIGDAQLMGLPYVSYIAERKPLEN